MEMRLVEVRGVGDGGWIQFEGGFTGKDVEGDL